MRLSSSAVGAFRATCWRSRWLLGAVVAVWLAAAAPAAAQPFVYVANDAGSSVSQYDAAGGMVSPLTPPTVPLPSGAVPDSVAISPDGTSVYVTDYANSRIFQFDVEADGVLVPKTPAFVSAGPFPEQVAASPDGKSVYVTHVGHINAGTSISQYHVGEDGTLSALTPATVPTGEAPGGLAVSANSRSVYVDAGPADAAIWQYSVDPATGALSPMSPATVPSGGHPGGLVISPDGKNLYTATRLVYHVGSGGELTRDASGSVAISGSSIAISPDGRNVYITSGADVFQLSVGAGGALSPKTPAFVATGIGLFGLVVSPDGKSVYVTGGGVNGFVYEFNVAADGTLAPKVPASVAAGASPLSIAITPQAAPVKPLTLFLDSHNAANCVPAGPGEKHDCPGRPTPTRTSFALQSGVYYEVDVSGTVNPWGGLGAKKCGDPEPAMQFPSPALPDAPGADDAQFRLALTRNFGQPCPKHEYPRKESAFQINLGQGWFHPIAVNDPSHPSGDVRGRQHPYTFRVTGLGSRAEFRYADYATSDNNGQFKITVKPTP